MIAIRPITLMTCIPGRNISIFRFIIPVHLKRSNSSNSLNLVFSFFFFLFVTTRFRYFGVLRSFATGFRFNYLVSFNVDDSDISFFSSRDTIDWATVSTVTPCFNIVKLSPKSSRIDGNKINGTMSLTRFKNIISFQLKMTYNNILR